MLQHRAKVAEKVGAKNMQIVKKMRTKNLQNGGPNPPQIEPRGRQEAARTPQKPKKKTDPTKKWIPLNYVAPFFAKKWPTWLQVGLPNQRKIEENRCKNRPKKRCIL